jgi:hypothetical protein
MNRARGIRPPSSPERQKIDHGVGAHDRPPVIEFQVNRADGKGERKGRPRVVGALFAVDKAGRNTLSARLAVTDRYTTKGSRTADVSCTNIGNLQYMTYIHQSQYLAKTCFGIYIGFCQ